MSSYALEGSYSTVQVLSPTLVQNVVYCTISTSPSGVIASMPVLETTFENNAAGAELTNFANAIEQIMQNTAVIAAVGSQTIDPTGLLTDNVVFTLEYSDPTTGPTGATAEAIVPVTLLNFSDAEIGTTLLGDVDDILNGVYGNLRSAAGG
jgi:hypothetical protein